MRLIDADALMDIVEQQGHVTVDDIINTPTIEAEPVVHTKWEIEMDDMGWNKHTCPNCGYVKRTDIHVSLGWNYCPNCGADMRGRRDDNAAD